MAHEIPEVREMIDCAKRFLADETNIHELHGHAQKCKSAAQLLAKNTPIIELASEWAFMSNRYWNEWGTAETPLTKEELENWLREQIRGY